MRYQSTVSSRIRITWSPVITAREASGGAASFGAAALFGGVAVSLDGGFWA